MATTSSWWWTSSLSWPGSELPIAFLFVEGNERESPHAIPALEQAQQRHPAVLADTEFLFADSAYDAVGIFEHILERIVALPLITKPVLAREPQECG